MRPMLTMIIAVTMLCACRTPEETGSEVKDDSGSNWHRIMTCNGGDAGVDVDLNERRNFQLVLSNGNAFQMFDQPGWTYGQLRNDHERIYRGRAIDGRGVFHGKDFVGFFANDVVGTDAGTFGFKVKRSTEHSDHSPPWTRLTFTAVNLRNCGGHITDNDFPSDCTIGAHAWNTCQIFD